MTDYGFIVQEPWLLDEYEMPDIERGLLVRLTNDQSGEMFPLKSVHQMLIDTLEYYRRQKIPFAIEIHGLNSIVRMRFVSLIAVAIGKDMGRATFIRYERDTSGIGYFILFFDYIEDEDGEVVTDVTFLDLPVSPIIPAAIVELLGYKKIGNGAGFEYLTVLFDRKYQKHGFVRFVDSDYYLEMLEQELLLQYLDLADEYYCIEADDELELEDIDEEH
jgi:hypothetical protein